MISKNAIRVIGIVASGAGLAAQCISSWASNELVVDKIADVIENSSKVQQIIEKTVDKIVKK